ncbi:MULTISPECIES: family 78 glycoside hydrolase catalytic domain [Streptomyces]|uniref:alpha-L-rhamnosidase n=1 Tax=Streptomyces glycanivorans TaxID=3033808 RepID=A0ABY9J5B8_9ACTN|nr:MULTISPECIES: family 78 glycoside hydrolase catalytic domain [unclassified Streptomyces]WLQ63020.1 family 78 glycoside hydrolase catalytic domain [Streptomyces sp. Alt3]WSQ83863.1 glycoside hydrolase family 78 protein [Streptomyces sp. NBC_01212]WSR10190.1 glycoside hydrolase family 78 protein [Streptomyces sp. NBC_01208]
MSAPTRLRVEFLDDAHGITEPRPRLSWLLPSDCRVQHAYQLRMGEWDSGKVESGESVLVATGAPPLRSRERRAWQVRVWTDAGRSDWSAPSWLEAGLLEPEDWQAAWIQPAEETVAAAGERPAHLLRGILTLPGAVTTARAHVTAEGIYELFVNGVRIGDDELTPGFTDYRSTLQVQTYDVGSLLRPGANTVGAVLSDGWFRGVNGMFRDADCFGTRTALLLQMHLTLHDGTEDVFCTDATWTSTTGGITRADLLGGVTADLRAEPVGWTSGVSDARTWTPVTVADTGYDRLAASPAPPVRRTGYRRPLSVSRSPSGAQVADFGENVVGWVRLSELGPRGTRLTLIHGEALTPDGEVTRRNLLPDHMPPDWEEKLNPGQVDVVVSAGRTGEVFEPRHATKGFRYVAVEGDLRDLTPDDLTAVVVHTDLRPTGTFRCADERLNRLHEIAVRSFLGNAVDIPTDCPTRERSGWTGDWALFVPTAAFLFDVAGFSRKWLRDLATQQFEDGVVPNFVPDQLGPATRDHPLIGENLGSAGWGDAAVIVPWEIFRAYGDRELLERQWPSMVAWVERAIRMAREGRHPHRAANLPEPAPHEEYLWDTGFHFGEWLEPGDQPGWEELRTLDQSAVATAYLRHSSCLLSRIAVVLGREAEAERYREISEHARLAWQTEFVDETGRVQPETQATLVRALAFDLVDADLRPSLAHRLAELVRAVGTRVGTGFLATPHLLPVLAETGYADLAYELLLQNTPPSWMHMLDNGATTVWELWEAIDADGVAHESLNHYSKGAVISFLHRFVAGLRVLDEGPGYRRFRVQPCPGSGLTWAEAGHDSPYGRIEVAWRNHGETTRMRVVVPPGTQAEVRLPDGRRADIGPGTALFEWTNRQDEA